MSLLESRVRPEKVGRREQRKAENRTRLLAAAEHLFTEKGFHETSPGEIAELADLGHGTFYSFFTDKQDCHHQLVCEKRQEMLSLLSDQLDGVPDFDQRLSTLTDIVVDISFRFPETVQMSVSDLHLSAPYLQDRCSFVDFWAPELARLLTVPGEKQVDAWPFGYMLAGNMVTIMALSQSSKVDRDSAKVLLKEQFIRHYRDIEIQPQAH